MIDAIAVIRPGDLTSYPGGMSGHGAGRARGVGHRGPKDQAL
jgi:hypothetical protein